MTLPEQVQAIREALAAETSPATVKLLAARFTRTPKDRLEELLETLVMLGQAKEVGEGEWVG
jgi:hypothetical protein